jgi:hypothetical protein
LLPEPEYFGDFGQFITEENKWFNQNRAVAQIVFAKIIKNRYKTGNLNIGEQPS